MVLDEVTGRISDELPIVDNVAVAKVEVFNDVDVVVNADVVDNIAIVKVDVVNDVDVVVTADGDFVEAVIVDFKDVVACNDCSGVDLSLIHI